MCLKFEFCYSWMFQGESFAYNVHVHNVSRQTEEAYSGSSYV